MEKGRCWMVSNGEAKCEDYSWEERAFAEDAAGMLGGCVWPPRSYSCNFCRREFRSAQALGGHMNVHRRDRARLKQMSAITHDHNQDPKLDHPQNPTYQNPAVKLPLSFADKRCTSNNQRVFINHPSPMFVPRASVVSIHQTIYTPESKFVSSFVVNNDRNLTFLSLSNNDDDTSKQVPLRNRKQLKRSSSNNTVVHNEEMHNHIHKRRKLDTCASTTMPIFINNGQDQEPKLDIPIKEDIDLELRLGHRPKVQ